MEKESFVPLTAENRVINFDLPTKVEIGNQVLDLPESLITKDVHYMINSSGELIEAAWVSIGLSRLFNGLAETDPELRNQKLTSCLQELYSLTNKLIKENVLRERRGPGAMSFSQAHESVPEGCVVISERSFKQLKASNPKWGQCSSVIATRFPNLGPGTTSRLKLIVDSNSEPLGALSIGSRINNVQELLSLFSDEESLPEDFDFLDAFYFNPKDLKNKFEGDGDGDLLYITVASSGKKPQFRKRKVERKPREVPENVFGKLLEKAFKTSELSMEDFMPTYFDKTPIGEATYAIRFTTWLTAFKLRKTSDHPMRDAWLQESKKAIDLIEFVMDIRKGNNTFSQIEKKLNYISNVMSTISKRQKEGCWFSRSVTSSSLMEPSEFVRKWPDLQKFVDFVIPTKKEENI